ncbi:hypothetical protein J6590_002074 [Homalodisca vitripennis]|nr:hypothetical protein J6590_002074 [Homalodisca vitripennis]
MNAMMYSHYCESRAPTINRYERKLSPARDKCANLDPYVTPWIVVCDITNANSLVAAVFIWVGME